MKTLLEAVASKLRSGELGRLAAAQQLEAAVANMPEHTADLQRFTVRWNYQGRTCTVSTESQINANFAAGGISYLYGEAVIWQGEIQIAKYTGGQSDVKA